MANSARFRLLVGILAVLSAIVALVWALGRRELTDRVQTVARPAAEETPKAYAGPQPSPTPLPTITVPTPQGPEATPTATTPQTQTETAPAPSTTAEPSAALLIPVAGVRPEQLRDTFTEARSSGRTHDAIDIPAPRGTPVLAAADGKVVKLFQSIPGGTTVYQLGTDGRTIYYYAHLDRYADGLKEGDFVRRGDAIAYVGDTGNAGAGNYHLHFSVSIVSDPKRYWEGTNVNPYPLLRGKQ